MKRLTILAFISIFLTSVYVQAENKTAFFGKRAGAGGGVVISDQTTTTGNTWFVDSGSSTGADAAGYGQSPDSPCLTIDYCVGLATANNGDVIVVMAGHAESVIAAAGLALDVAGLRIVGQGVGRNRPTITLSTATSADIDINAANITLENMIIDLTEIDAVAAGIDINAADFTLKNCEIITADSAGQAVIGATLDSAADRTTVEDCQFIGSTDTGTTAAFYMTPSGPPDKVTMTGVYMSGDYASAGIFGSGASCTVVIQDSYIRNYQNGDHAIEFQGTEDGVINNVVVATNAVATSIDPAAVDVFNTVWDDDATDNTQAIPIFVAPIASAPADSVTAMLAGANGISAWPSAAAPANSVSIAEALREVYDALRNGTGGTEPDTNKSIIDAIGTNGTTLVDGTGSVIGAIGVNDADNDFVSSNVADNADGSLFERLEHVQSDTDKIDGITLAVDPVANSLAAFIASGGTALGTELADSKSIVDALGTDGTTPIDTATSILGAIGVNDANNAMDTATVVPNADGSVFERLEALEATADPSYNHPNFISLSVDLNSATWNTAAAHEILTVTGNIRLQIMIECTETLTDAADGATISLGDEITVAGMIAATSAAGSGAANQIDSGEFWIDNTPADVSPVAKSSAILDFIVLQGADVGYTIAGEAITDGTLVISMWWTPLDATGAAVVGAGGAL